MLDKTFKDPELVDDFGAFMNDAFPKDQEVRRKRIEAKWVTKGLYNEMQQWIESANSESGQSIPPHILKDVPSA